MVAFKAPLCFVMATLILLHNLNAVVAPSRGAMVVSRSSSFSSLSPSLSPAYINGDGGGGHASRDTKIGIYSLLGGISVILLIIILVLSKRKRVVMIQIALPGSLLALRRELNIPFWSTDASTSVGLNFMLHNTASVLLQQPGYWISGYSYKGRAWTIGGVNSLLHELTEKEREKREKVDVDVEVKRKFVRRVERNRDEEFFVATILVGAKRGCCSVPKIKDRESLKKGLQKLMSFELEDGDRVVLLWSPRSENLAFLAEELRAHYPLLKSF